MRYINLRLTYLLTVLDPDAARLREYPCRTIRALALTVLLKLPSFLVFLALFFFNFLNFMLTVQTDRPYYTLFVATSVA